MIQPGIELTYILIFRVSPSKNLKLFKYSSSSLILVSLYMVSVTWSQLEPIILNEKFQK